MNGSPNQRFFFGGRCGDEERFFLVFGGGGGGLFGVMYGSGVKEFPKIKKRKKKKEKMFPLPAHVPCSGWDVLGEGGRDNFPPPTIFRCRYLHAKNPPFPHHRTAPSMRHERESKPALLLVEGVGMNERIVFFGGGS